MRAERPTPFDRENPDARGEIQEGSLVDHAGDHVLKPGETVHFTDHSRPTHSHATTEARASHFRKQLRDSADLEDITFLADADHEVERQARLRRQRQDVRSDRQHDTLIHRAGKKTVQAAQDIGQKSVDTLIPQGSKRRTGVKVAATAAVLVPTAIGVNRAVETVTDSGAQVAYKVGKQLGKSADSEGAPFGAGIDVSTGQVERTVAEKDLADAAAEHEAAAAPQTGVTSSVDLDSDTSTDETGVTSPESFDAQTGGMSAEDAGDTGGVSAS